MLTPIRTGSAVALVTALLIQAPAAFADAAEEQNNWRSVSVLRPGDDVLVKTAKEKVGGSFREVSDYSISLTAAEGRVTTFSRQDVLEVWRPSRASARATSVLGVGVLACVAAQLVLSLKRSGSLRKSQVSDAAPGIAAAGLAGGAIIFAIKIKGKKIYQAQQP